eukprot:10037432-Heterocapsa_arctica.AAC.1
MSIVLDVDAKPRQNTAHRQTVPFGEENTANQLLELKDTGKGNTILFSMDGGHVRVVLLEDLA